MRTMLIVAALFLALSATAEAKKKELVGGPCSYDEFPGYCTAAGKDASGKGTFTFVGAVGGQDVDLAGNALMDGMSIRSKSMPCKLEFIKKGTCTPCVFSIGECGAGAWDLFRSWAKHKK